MAVALQTHEPPEPVRKPAVQHYVIGRDAEGHWVAVESKGREGGLFASREAALKYVIEQTGRRCGAALFSSEPLSLWK